MVSWFSACWVRFVAVKIGAQSRSTICPPCRRQPGGYLVRQGRATDTMAAEHPQARAGLMLGGTAIVLWSLSSTCTVFMGQRLGVWQFLALTPLVGGLLQLAGYLILGRSVRSLLRPPAKLWLAIALGFVLYLLCYTLGLATATTAAQAMEVSLMNYLWPALAVLFTTWLVPGELLTLRLALAVALALAGVLLACGPDLAWPMAGESPWPCLLGGVAAAAWASYCALTARWRHWARDYAAAPLGFLAVGAVAAVVCTWRQAWEPMDLSAWGGVLLTAAGPWAAGYMLWELALHRAPPVTLSMLGAATPMLSTLCLMALFALTTGLHTSGTRLGLLLGGAVLIGVAVLLGSARRGAARA